MKEARALIQSSVDIAKDAVREVSLSGGDSQNYYVAASVGPYGATLHDLSEYNGHYVDEIDMQVNADKYQVDFVIYIQCICYLSTSVPYHAHTVSTCINLPRIKTTNKRLLPTGIYSVHANNAQSLWKI